jgi:hypothetical protein
MARFPVSGPKYAIDGVSHNVSADTAMVIQGHFMVPWYLNTDGVVDSENCRLVLSNATGLPVFQGFQPINFTVTVPWSVMAAGAPPGRIVQYGHGYVYARACVMTE